MTRTARLLVPVLLLTAACAGRTASVRRAPPMTPAGSATPVGGSRIETARVHSALLGRSIRVLIYLPRGYSPAKRYPTIYLLHGVPGTPDGLFENLNLSAQLDALIDAHRLPPTIVVAPTGNPTPSTDTEWADSAVHPSQRWASFVADELVPWVDRSFATCADRRDRAVSGLSMGAFGATNLALRHRALFGTLTSWSGYFVANTPSVEGTPGSPAWRHDSPLDYVPGLRPSLASDPIRISFYVGDADRFAPSDRAFDRELSRLGIQHRFRIVAGGHDWDVWRSQLAAELTWVGRGFSCPVTA